MYVVTSFCVSITDWCSARGVRPSSAAISATAAVHRASLCHLPTAVGTGPASSAALATAGAVIQGQSFRGSCVRVTGRVRVVSILGLVQGRVLWLPCWKYSPCSFYVGRCTTLPTLAWPQHPLLPSILPSSLCSARLQQATSG